MSEPNSLFEPMDHLATGGGDRGYAFVTEETLEAWENSENGNQSGGRK